MIHTVFEAFMVCHTEQHIFILIVLLSSMNIVECSSLYIMESPLILAQFTHHIWCKEMSR